MKFRLRRLRYPQFKRLLSLIIDALLIWQRCVNYLGSVRPKDLVIWVMLSQMILLVFCVQHPPAEAMVTGVVGNLVIVGFAMLPVTMRNKGGI